MVFIRECFKKNNSADGKNPAKLPSIQQIEIYQIIKMSLKIFRYMYVVLVKCSFFRNRNCLYS